MLHILALLLVILVLPEEVLAQEIPGLTVNRQFKTTINGDHYHLEGEVEVERDDMQFFADVIDYWRDSGRVEATGNVVFVSPNNRIAADRLSFNMNTKLGTFYNAAGTATLTENIDRTMFGTQEPDAYFFGETIDKIGPEKYRVSKGGFTTCVQPTPRWEFVATTVTITLDKYATLRNPVLKVKGVPIFYSPFMYYPIKEDRSTGFLLPVYGSSTIRGQSLSNAFFWAINRSQDATFYHDYFSKTGQGFGSEYRYISAPGSEGAARYYFLDETTPPAVNSAGVEEEGSERRSFNIRANATQRLGAGMRARVNIDYFSNIVVQQIYQTNVYDASLRSRTYGGNLSGTWGADSVSFTYNVNQLYYGTEDFTRFGGTPRVSYSRAARRLGGSPFYVGVGTEFAQLVRESQGGGQLFDQGLQRFDAAPYVRVPFTRWPFLTFNSSVTWKNTWYSESLDPRGTQIEESLFRRYFDMRADIVGPVFTRVWDTPNSGYAQKFKHVIEPNFGIQRTTSIEEFDQIVKLETIDYAVGDTTKITYGVTNRFLARRQGDGRVSNAREFLNVNVFQSYYTDALASQFDPSFNSSYGLFRDTKFSPWVISVRGAPTDRTSAQLRIEYDQSTGEFLTIRANGSASIREWLVAGAGWSQRSLGQGFPKDNFLNSDTTVRVLDGRVGGSYRLNLDLTDRTVLQQRITAFYNAQCCGIGFEFQKYNLDYYSLPRDTRFNITFTLAGIGTFSTMMGAMSGTSSGAVIR